MFWNRYCLARWEYWKTYTLNEKLERIIINWENIDVETIFQEWLDIDFFWVQVSNINDHYYNNSYEKICITKDLKQLEINWNKIKKHLTNWTIFWKKYSVFEKSEWNTICVDKNRNELKKINQTEINILDIWEEAEYNLIKYSKIKIKLNNWEEEWRYIDKNWTFLKIEWEYIEKIWEKSNFFDEEYTYFYSKKEWGFSMNNEWKKLQIDWNNILLIFEEINLFWNEYIPLLNNKHDSICVNKNLKILTTNWKKIVNIITKETDENSIEVLFIIKKDNYEESLWSIDIKESDIDS